EGRARRIWFGLELEAVLGVEPPRLHDVPHEWIENRQRQARYGDLRPLLRNRRARPEQGQRARRRERCEAATRKRSHGAPLPCLKHCLPQPLCCFRSTSPSSCQDIELARIS